MFSGRTLRAEGKGKAFVAFRNTAKVIVPGNHKPNFPSHDGERRARPPASALEFHHAIDQLGMKDDRRSRESRRRRRVRRS